MESAAIWVFLLGVSLVSNGFTCRVPCSGVGVDEQAVDPMAIADAVELLTEGVLLFLGGPGVRGVGYDDDLVEAWSIALDDERPGSFSMTMN